MGAFGESVVTGQSYTPIARIGRDAISLKNDSATNSIMMAVESSAQAGAGGHPCLTLDPGPGCEDKCGLLGPCEERASPPPKPPKCDLLVCPLDDPVQPKDV